MILLGLLVEANSFVLAEEQGFVEFNEVRYTTRFIAREPKPAPRGSSNEEDGILIRFDD